jgi:hypothetical protein
MDDGNDCGASFLAGFVVSVVIMVFGEGRCDVLLSFSCAATNIEITSRKTIREEMRIMKFKI